MTTATTAPTLTPEALEYVTEKWNLAEFGLLTERPVIAMQYAQIARTAGNRSTLRAELWDQITTALAVERAQVLAAVSDGPVFRAASPSVIARSAGRLTTQDTRVHLEALTRDGLVRAFGNGSRTKYLRASAASQ